MSYNIRQIPTKGLSVKTDIKSLIGAKNIHEHANPLLMIKEGIKTDAVAHIESITGINKRHILRTIGITDKTYIRRVESKLLKEDESDRLYTFSNVFTHAITVFGSIEKARKWLYSPVAALDNEKPINICYTIQGLLQVDEVLYRIQYGIFS